jgi:hypothetical protein
MKFLKIVALCLVTLIHNVYAQPITLIGATQVAARYRFENDASLVDLLARWAVISRYEVTFVGQHDLPIVAELKAIETFNFKDAVVSAMGAYKTHNFGVVMIAQIDDTKRHLYLTSRTAAEQAQLLQPKDLQQDTAFSVKDADTSLMQVLVRWAKQAGYQSVINEQPVNLDVFPRHSTRYSDFSLLNETKSFTTQSPFKDAVSQLIILYTGRSLAPFNVVVDESTKRLNIVSLVK